MRNTLLFAGSLFGTALLIGGVVALQRGERTGWTYIIGAVAAYALAFAPGRRLRDKLQPPDA